MKIQELAPEQFAAYLAGLVDGEGSIEIHPKECGMRLRVGLTTPAVLFDVCNRLRLGKVLEDKSRTKKGIKRLWSWSVNNARDCRDIFNAILPYAQIKFDRLVYALAVIQRMQNRMDALDNRNLTILAAIASGEQQNDIASRFGVSQSLISRIKCGHTWPCEIARLNARRGLKKGLRPSDQIFRLHGEPLVSFCRQPSESADLSSEQLE